MKKKLENYNKMIEKLNCIVTKKNMLIVLIVLTIVLLFPILRVSFYTHPSADDFNYGVNTINIIQEKGIIGVARGSIKTLIEFYKTWQGTYSAIILFTLNPSILGENMYFLTTFIIIGFFFLGLYCFLKPLLQKVLNVDKITFWLFLLGFFLLSLETIPSKCQGLFWWNGASYYMIFFSLELIEIGLLIKRYILEKKTKLNYVLLCILIAIIGGGNFITALQQIILLFFLNIYLIFAKKNKSAIPLFILSILSLGISALAPGNAIRASSLTGMNPVEAILNSFIYSIIKIFEWMTPTKFVVIFLLSILLYPTYKKIKINFKYPLIFIALIYCIFSAEFTPTLYSASNIGEGRLWNIMYISYLLFCIMVIYYVIGFIRARIIEDKIKDKNVCIKIIELIKKYNFFIIIIIVGFISISCYFNRGEITSYNTYIILKNGEAKQYDEEYKERLKLLEDNNIENVEFKRLSVYPYPIVFSEFSRNPKSWLNVPIQKIYNKKSVRIIN